MATSGEECKVSGIYKIINHVQHPKEITMVKGKIFPPCAKCKTKVDYELEKKTEH